MDSRITLTALVAMPLLLAGFAHESAATEPAAKPAAQRPAFSSGDDSTLSGTDAGGDKVAPAGSDTGGDWIAAPTDAPSRGE